MNKRKIKFFNKLYEEILGYVFINMIDAMFGRK